MTTKSSPFYCIQKYYNDYFLIMFIIAVITAAIDAVDEPIARISAVDIPFFSIVFVGTIISQPGSIPFFEEDFNCVTCPFKAIE
jgi:hypothetical protein